MKNKINLSCFNKTFFHGLVAVLITITMFFLFSLFDIPTINNQSLSFMIAFGFSTLLLITIWKALDLVDKYISFIPKRDIFNLIIFDKDGFSLINKGLVKKAILSTYKWSQIKKVILYNEFKNIDVEEKGLQIEFETSKVIRINESQANWSEFIEKLLEELRIEAKYNQFEDYTSIFSSNNKIIFERK